MDRCSSRSCRREAWVFGRRAIRAFALAGMRRFTGRFILRLFAWKSVADSDGSMVLMNGFAAVVWLPMDHREKMETNNSRCMDESPISRLILWQCEWTKVRLLR